MTNTIFNTPFLSTHPVVRAMLSGMGNDYRWREDGEHFFISIDDKFGRQRFVTTYKPLNEFRELAESYFSPAYRPRFRGDVTWFHYLLRYDTVSYVAVVKILPTPLKRGKVVLSPKAQTQLLFAKARKLVKSKIYRRLGTLKVPRSTTIRPSSESNTVSYDEIFERNNGGYAITITPKTRESRLRQWTGVRTPNFGKLRKSQLPVNPHTVWIRETPLDASAEWEFTNSTSWALRSCQATLHYILPPTPTHLSLAQNLAVRRLINRGQLGIDANLAQDFAQLGQTTRLIGDNAYRIVGSIKALRKGNLRQAADILMQGQTPGTRHRGILKSRSFGTSVSNSVKAVANNWLMLQYGWKPLLNDIHGSLQSLKFLTNSSNFIQVVTASANVKAVSSKSFMLWNAPKLPGGSEVTMTQTRCKLRLRYKIDDKLKAFLAQLGFTNPVNLAWETLPFSFVADWFFPLGPFLETLSAWDGLIFVDGSQTLFTRNRVALAIDYHGKGNPDNPLRSYDVTARRLVSTVLLNRTKLTTFPASNLPSFKNGLLSVVHAQNGLALLAKYFV